MDFDNGIWRGEDMYFPNISKWTAGEVYLIQSWAVDAGLKTWQLMRHWRKRWMLRG